MSDDTQFTLPPFQTPDAAMDTQKVMSLIRRSFTSDASEVLGELLQNSQRAHATTVQITSDELPMCDLGHFSAYEIRERWMKIPATLVYHDNGQGLEEGLYGILGLLTIGWSLYQDESVKQQHPMGVGFMSLLAHERVKTVTIRSGGYAIQIETSRWWDERSYRDGWEALVTPDTSDGFTVEISTDKWFVEQFASPLTKQDHMWGYIRYFTTHYNGEEITHSLPQTITAPEVQVTVRGVDIYATTTEQTWKSVIDWYGQLTETSLTHSTRYLKIILRVHEGTPFDMLSPTRRGPIANARWQAFGEEARQALLAAFMAIERPTAAQIRAMYSLCGPGQEQYTVPWVVLNQLETQSKMSDDCPGTANRRSVLCPRSKLAGLTILDDDTVTITRGHPAPRWSGREDDVSPTSPDYGLRSFLRVFDGPVFTAEVGPVPSKRFWWRPGPATHPCGCTEPGEWGLSDEDSDAEPEVWHPLPAPTKDEPYFVLYEVECDFEEANFFWCTPDPVHTLRRYATIGHHDCSDCDCDDAEGCTDSYDSSVEYYLMQHFAREERYLHEWRQVNFQDLHPASLLREIKLLRAGESRQVEAVEAHYEDGHIEHHSLWDVRTVV